MYFKIFDGTCTSVVYCSSYSLSGTSAFVHCRESGTCTQRFEWSTDADSMQSPIETAKQRLANAEAQLSDATPADLRMSATSPLELSELQLDSDDVVNVNTIFKPIDLHGDSRPPPTTAREEFFQKRRRETLERKNKRLLTRIKEREEAAKAADKSWYHLSLQWWWTFCAEQHFFSVTFKGTKGQNTVCRQLL